MSRAIVIFGCVCAVALLLAQAYAASKPQPCAAKRISEFTCIREKNRDVYGMEVWACVRFTGEP